MRDLISTTTVLMSTREIAVLTDSAHDNVLKAVRRMAAGGVVSPNETSYVEPQNGQRYVMYELSFRDTMVVVSGYNAMLRARIIDRWLELEASPPSVPATVELSRMDLIELAMAAERERLVLVAQVAADAPKVAFAEAVRHVDGLCSLEKIAKTLGWGRNRFIAHLKESKVLQLSRIPYQKYIDRGYFEVVEQTPWEDSKGVSHPSFTTMVTGAGQVWLAKNFQHERMVAPQPAATGAALETAH